MVNQAVPPGQHQAIQIGLCHHIQTDLYVIHPQPDVAHQPFSFHALQLGQGLAHHLLQHAGVVHAMGLQIAVMDVHHIQPRHAQALQTVFHAAAHACGRVVPHLLKRQHIDVAVLVARRTLAGPQQPAHLGRQHQVIAGHSSQCVAKPVFAQAVAVVRRGIQRAAARLQRGRQHRLRLRIRHGSKQIAQRRAAQSNGSPVAEDAKTVMVQSI